MSVRALSPGVPAVRQTADSASDVIEKCGPAPHPTFRKAVDAIFRLDVEESGEHSVEFLQGFFSGLAFAQMWLAAASVNQLDPAVMMVSDLTIEAARKYLEKIENHVQS